MTAMEFLLKRGIWLRRELHFENVSKLMEEYADQQTAEKDIQLKDLHQWIKELEAKVYFYREATDKVRELVSNSKEIGLPNQPLYDAIFDRIKQEKK